MKNIKSIICSVSLSLFLLLSSCSCNNENANVAKIYPDIENIAKEHAMQFAKQSLSDMQIQQKLFEVKAHEQDLREANMNDEADYYIKSFKLYLKNINPKLSKEIERQ